MIAVRCDFSLVWAILFAAALAYMTAGAAEPEPKAEAKKPPTPTIVSAQALAQAVEDDVNATARRYQLTELQTDGVVAEHAEHKDKVAVIKFKLMVKDRETGKMVEFTIFCVLKTPMQKGDQGLDAMAVGAKVTVRGTSIAMGNRQLTLGNCVLAGEREK